MSNSVEERRLFMIWEYKVQNFVAEINGMEFGNVNELLGNLLNQIGSEGWELISSTPIEPNKVTNIQLVFKRPKE